MRSCARNPRSARHVRRAPRFDRSSIADMTFSWLGTSRWPGLASRATPPGLGTDSATSRRTEAAPCARAFQAGSDQL